MWSEDSSTLIFVFRTVCKATQALIRIDHNRVCRMQLSQVIQVFDAAKEHLAIEVASAIQDDVVFRVQALRVFEVIGAA